MTAKVHSLVEGGASSEARPVVVFDLDGTLSDATHRLHYIEQKPADWTAFFDACDQDAPVWPVIKACCMYAGYGYDVWIVTGRNDQVVSKTVDWLRTYMRPLFSGFAQGDVALLMRPDGDRRPDNEVKQEWINEGDVPTHAIDAVYEDRSRVVDMWRANGLTCFQVAGGDF